MRYLFILLFFCLPCAYAQSTIYQSYDAKGNLIYADQPMGKDIKIIETPAENLNITTTSNEPAKPAAVIIPGETAEPSKLPYQTFSMTSPGNEETFYNQPSIKVTLNVKPALQAGDKIQIFLDGKPWGNARPATEFEFIRPDRGTHEIYAQILDEKMRTIKQTDSHTFYVHQSHLGNRSAF